MKPLELTIYPLWENDLDGSCYTGTTIDDVVNVDYEVYRKRLTPAELAAELWHSCFREAEAEVRGRRPGGDVDYWSPINQEAVRHTKILERFTSLPNYDEVTA